MGLPPVGVRLVAENYVGWQKAMDAVTKRINEAGDAAEKSSKRSDPLTRAFETVKKALQSGNKSNGFSQGILKGIDTIETGAGKLKDTILSFLSEKGAGGEAIAGVVGQIEAIPLAATVATAAIAAVTAGIIALGAGFISLGERGAPLIGLAQAFDNITASVGLTSQAQLVDLRKASAGTISDFKLIETANAALSGATGDLGVELGNNLPRLLEIARNQAKVTGKDVDFLFNSIVEGIRKSSPLRIDNALLIIKEGKAQAEYAKKVGKTVDQLTVEEKGIAILNATLEAGNAALEQSGNMAETNAEKQARSAAHHHQYFRQPGGGSAARLWGAAGHSEPCPGRLPGGCQRGSADPGAIASIIMSVFGTIFDTISTILQPIFNPILSFAPYFSIAFQAVANVFAGTGGCSAGQRRQGQPAGSQCPSGPARRRAAALPEPVGHRQITFRRDLCTAQANQAQERALLSIRKAAVEASQPGGTATTTAGAGAQKEKEKKGEATPLPAAPEGAPIGISTQGSVLDLFGGQQAVNDAIAGIQDSFASELDTSGLGTFQGNSVKLKTQLDRIGSVDLGKKLGDKFKGFTDLFDPAVENSPANVISRFFSPDPSTPGSVASFLNSLRDSIAAISKDVGTRIGTELADAFIFFTGDGEGTLKGILSIVTGDATVEGSVANFFSLLPQRVSDAASGLFDTLKTGVFDPVSNFLTGPDSDPSTLAGILNTAVFFFEQLPSQIVAALQGIGATLYMAFAVPVITVINSVIEAAESVVKTFLTGVANFLLGIADGLGSMFDTSGIRNVANDINAKSGGVNFGRISTALPAFLVPSVPGVRRAVFSTKVC